MAKNATAATPSPFKIEAGLSIPVALRGGGKAPIPYPFATMKPGQSFLIDVKVPDNITDAAEREKAFKEEGRRVANRVGGSIRRHRKTAGNEKHVFAVRLVDDATLGKGVRVWRDKDAT